MLSGTHICLAGPGLTWTAPSPAVAGASAVAAAAVAASAAAGTRGSLGCHLLIWVKAVIERNTACNSYKH